MKNSRNGTDRPSLSPASTFSAWRIFSGTRGLLTMICPSPASVGARMAARMPASQSVNGPKTTSAPRPPSRIVNSIPVLSSRTGNVRMSRNTLRSVRLASAKSSNTSPISATVRNNAGLPCLSLNSGSRASASIPAAVNTIGAVTTVRANRAETRPWKKSKAMKMMRRVIPGSRTRAPSS